MKTIRTLKQAGVPLNILLAPVIPVLTDREMEMILQAVAQAGADTANYILLRLPGELLAFFTEWLQQHYPDRANHVIKQIQQRRHRKHCVASFEHRASGHGHIADMISQRFKLARQKNRLTQKPNQLNCELFQPHPV